MPENSVVSPTTGSEKIPNINDLAKQLLPIIGRRENPANRCDGKQRDPAECGKKIKGGATYILDKAMHMSETVRDN